MKIFWNYSTQTISQAKAAANIYATWLIFLRDRIISATTTRRLMLYCRLIFLCDDISREEFKDFINAQIVFDDATIDELDLILLEYKDIDQEIFDDKNS